MANLLGNNFADRAVSCPAYTSGIDGANARRAGKLGHSLNLPRIFVGEAGQAQGLQLFCAAKPALLCWWLASQLGYVMPKSDKDKLIGAVLLGILAAIIILIFYHRLVLF